MPLSRALKTVAILRDPPGVVVDLTDAVQIAARHQAFEPVLIDAEEAADVMGIPLVAFYARVRRGKIPRAAVVRTGRRVQFIRSKLPGVS